MEAWNSIRGWAERKARLLGLDSAAKVELGGGVTYQIVGVDPEQVK